MTTSIRPDVHERFQKILDRARAKPAVADDGFTLDEMADLEAIMPEDRPEAHRWNPYFIRPHRNGPKHCASCGATDHTRRTCPA